MPAKNTGLKPESLHEIRTHMAWWRKEQRTLATSSRAIDIRSGSLIGRLLDAIEREPSPLGSRPPSASESGMMRA